MNTTFEEKQNNESQQKRPVGESEINTINNLARTRGLLKNPLGKFGPRLMAQAGRTVFTFIAANPWVWLVLGIILLAVVVFVIVLGSFGAAPGAPTTEPSVQTISPIITPTPTTTPTPTPVP